MPAALTVRALAEGELVVSRHRIEIAVGKGDPYFLEFDTAHLLAVLSVTILALVLVMRS